jgi:hypothetical protein
MDWRGWASATSGVAQELPRSCPKAGVDLLSEMVMGVGVTWIPAFAGKTMVMGVGVNVDSGFRRKDDISLTVALPPNSGMTHVDICHSCDC